jgi:putative nucleotidyltransferase with HDIG domain
MEGIVKVMEFAIGVRDPYTVAHQQRVTHLACALAKEMGLPTDRIETLRLAGSLHDLGKIAVPGEILSKPGKLNATEFAIVKTHPQVGYNILQPLKFPGPTTKIILQHHERIDGSGYPQGLRGNDILLEARILGVADVVEAMCSHRPYRPALGLEEALAEISQNRGILYDSLVVDRCLELCTEDRYVKAFFGTVPTLLQGAYNTQVLRGVPTRNNAPVRVETADDPSYPLFPASWFRFFVQATAASILGGILMTACQTL